MAIATMYGLAAVAASSVVVAAGWRSRHRGGPPGSGVPDDPLWGQADSPSGGGSEAGAEVWGAIHRALTRVSPLMASQEVTAEVAAPFGLRGQMDGAVLADLLAQVLATCVRAAPGGRLLLTASRVGGGIEVSVTDPAPGADRAIRVAAVRGLMDTVARCGGEMDVAVRPAVGTTVTLRFAAMEEGRGSETPPEPAEGAVPP
jgi:hypothetical protein